MKADAEARTPVTVALQGAAAGLAATLLLSALARVLPAMDGHAPGKKQNPPQPPQDPDDRDAVRDWQMRSQSPAAFRDEPQGRSAPEGAPGITPGGALAQPVSPGPEGLAEQFAFKLASGLFGRDITRAVPAAGKAVHVAYGSAWGVLYGLLQASYRRPPLRNGPLFGFFVYLVGPACLVPAMKLMRPPSEEPPLRTAMLVAGHIAYGVALAGTFELLQGEER